MTKLKNRFSWDKTWQGRQSQLSLTHLVMWRELCKHINLKGCSYLEIGAGSGVFGKLALEAGALRVCLLDKSPQAIKMCRDYIGSDRRVSYILSDAINFRPSNKFDIVLSNGLIEHFLDQDQELIVNAHVDNSSDLVILMAPASPHFNDKRCQYPWALQQYGPQFPITLEKMESILRAAHLEPVVVERFYPLYSLKLNRLFPFQHKALAIIDFLLVKVGFYHLVTWLTNPLGKQLGGYILAVGKIR